MYTDEQRLIVYPFSQQVDGDEVVIGRADTGVFVAIPDRAVSILHQLATGATVSETVERYRHQYDEIPDIQSFLEAMAQYGLIAEQSDHNLQSYSHPVKQARNHFHFSGFPEPLARTLFGRVALIIYGAVICSALILAMSNHSLIVTQRDLEFPNHRTLSIVLLTLGSYVALALHEFGHLIAGRSLGINSRFGLGHRLWVLVVETDLTGLWSVPTNKRYIPLLAGIIVDAVSAALLVLLLFAAYSHIVSIPPFLERIIRGMVFMYFVRIAWQLFFFVRTDFYYVIATRCGCKNLMRDTEVYIRNVLSRVLPRIRHTNQSMLPIRELRAVKIYSLIWFCGRIGALALLLTVTIPVSLYYVRVIAKTLAMGYSIAPGAYIDSILLAFYILLPIVVGMGMWTNSMFRRLRGSF